MLVVIIGGATDEGHITGIIQVQSGITGWNKEFKKKPQELLNELDELYKKDNLLVSNEPLILETMSLYNEREHFTKKRNSNMEQIVEWWCD